MDNGWRPKPGDRVIHPRRRWHLRKALGLFGLFSAGYGDVGSSIYYALGLVALIAVGATPIVLGIACVIYVLNALSYAEGGAMIPEAGGSASFARRGFNDIFGFIAGWALILSYVAIIAISAYTIPPYLSHFWPSLHEPLAGAAVSLGAIAFLMIINILGVRGSVRLNIFFVAIDIATLLILGIIGIVLIVRVNPGLLAHNIFGPGNWPPAQNLVYGVAIAALCFTGVETVSQLAEETKIPSRRIPRAYFLMIAVVLVMLTAISVVAISAMTPQILGDPVNGWARSPVAGIAANLPLASMRNVFSPLVSVLATTTLLAAGNAGLLGISRLTFNLSSHQQLPAMLSKIHSRFRTPHLAILTFSVIVMLVLLVGVFTPDNYFANLGGLYVFGSLVCFSLAHLAILRLRVREPDLPRPFKIAWNVRIKGRELPVSAILGLLITAIILVVVIIFHPYSRWGGLVWMIIGLASFYVFRRFRGLPLSHVGQKFTAKESMHKLYAIDKKSRT
jgi:APA family basic amino acid/polyamine antiporter